LNRSDPALNGRSIELPRERLGRLGVRALAFETIGSTNDVAAALAAEGDGEGVIVIADQQTAGRGRRGHVWFSPPGAGLYVSVILAPARSATDPLRATMLTTVAAGVAIGEGIERATGLRSTLKWPNDVYVGRRKLAGILAEGVGAGERAQVVLGYGVNVSAAAYPRDVAERATSLETELGRPVDGRVALIETLAALAARYDDLLAGRFDAILTAWRVRAPMATGARVTWSAPDGPRHGVTAGIADDGALLVTTDSGIERIVAGEVVWS
jgi:BirA family biotin operon repressor/biotin-[acetyl-CoA-carboxylase] ligase